MLKTNTIDIEVHLYIDSNQSVSYNKLRQTFKRSNSSIYPDNVFKAFNVNNVYVYLIAPPFFFVCNVLKFSFCHNTLCLFKNHFNGKQSA